MDMLLLIIVSGTSMIYSGHAWLTNRPISKLENRIMAGLMLVALAIPVLERAIAMNSGAFALAYTMSN